MSKISILQSNYIPWRGYFDIISKSDVFVIYDEVQYTKNDWRNRNLIKSPSGLIWLTIPVRQLNLEQKINETNVSLKNWNVKHWNSINANYAKAPFFKELESLFKNLYLNIETDNLSEINITFIRAISKFLNIKTEIISSKELNLKGDKNERLIQAVKALNGTHYLSGPAAKNYLDEEAFKKENIQVEWMNYSIYEEYPQLHPPFAQNVSILDMIFNNGADSQYFFSQK
jgi:hypothetical protein